MLRVSSYNSAGYALYEGNWLREESGFENSAKASFSCVSCTWQMFFSLVYPKGTCFYSIYEPPFVLTDTLLLLRFSAPIIVPLCDLEQVTFFFHASVFVYAKYG